MPATVKLARCRCTPSHLEPFACPSYGPCPDGRHTPNAAGTACQDCGLHAELVDPAELAAALIDELSRYRLEQIIRTESVVLMDGQLAVPLRALVGGLEAERLERAATTARRAELAAGDHFAYPTDPTAGDFTLEHDAAGRQIVTALD